MQKNLHIVKPYIKLSLQKLFWQHDTLGEKLRGLGGGGGGWGCLCHIPPHHQKRLIYSETLGKTESPKQNFNSTTPEEKMWGDGVEVVGGVYVTYPTHHHPTPDTQI